MGQPVPGQLTIRAPRSRLAACTNPLLDRATLPGVAFTYLRRLEDLLARHTPFRRHERMETGETWTEAGLAISPSQAALCLQDVARTRSFASGLHAAVTASLARDTGRVHVLYAGCGPYALLALPTMMSLAPDQVRFTLLDLHRPSLDSVQALVDAFDLGEWVAEVVQADATTYRVPEGGGPDVVLTETMMAGLEKEPQVAITRNLLDQAPSAILVPESVRVDAYLLDPAEEFQFAGPDGGFLEPRHRGRIRLGTAFELSRARALEWRGVRSDVLPGGRIHIPRDVDERYEIMLLTSVHVFDGLLISERDSGLTVPRPFPHGPEPVPGATFEFGYRLGRNPGLVARAVRGEDDPDVNPSWGTGGST